MKKFGTLVLFLTLCLLQSLQAQQPKDFAVMLNVSAQKTPSPRITVAWAKDNYAKQYSIFRRLFGATVWGNPVADLDSTATKYVDSSIVVGKQYEYQVYKKAVQNDTIIYLGTGYAVSGIEVPPPASRGKVLLLIDSSIVTPLNNEINRLERDLQSEAWVVVRRSVSRTEAFNGQAVKNVKNVIMQEYNSDKKNLKSVFILGRIAVPYSGKLNPDGHPDHLGAWPADCYYGDIDGSWTDKSKDSAIVGVGREQNKNVPGDGKFDQTGFDESLVPINIELQVGRVDFYDMPSFRDTTIHKSQFACELDLLKRYLDKNHAYRTGMMNVKTKGWVADNFGSYGGDMFSNSGWRNFSALLGDTNVKAGDFFTGVADSNVLWAYGCGGGYYNSCGGVGVTDDFVKKPVYSVFNMLFGSYFGDWDSQNNIMRAVLASNGSALTCSWAGRPHWYYHTMGMGETIGYSTVLSQNNIGGIDGYMYRALYNKQYPNGVIIQPYGTRWVHNALMGDPTLRMNMKDGPVPPKPSKLVRSITKDSSGIHVILNWEFEAKDTVKIDGYFVYRSDSPNAAYKQLNPTIITERTYTDNTVLEQKPYSYLVRAAKLKQSTTGSYYDLSDSVGISLTTVGVDEQHNAIAGMVTSPVPAVRYSDIHFTMEQSGVANLVISDLSGNTIKSLGKNDFQSGDQTIRWDLSDSRGNRVGAGVYLLTLTQDKHSQTVKIVVAN